MQMITRFDSVEELNAFLKHVGEVRKADSQPLRRGNLEKHVANLLGVCDWNTALGMVSKKEASEPAKCCACKQPLMPNGFCGDTECFHHEWPQAAEKGSDTVYRRMTLPAYFQSDSEVFKAHFDASPYFEYLIKDHHSIAFGIILEIFKQQGSGCCETDDIARSFSDTDELQGYRSFPGYSVIVDAFDHFDKPYTEETGFEVYVETDALARWLKANHEEIFDLLPDEFKDLSED
mgnify:CR=1 FL=1